MIDPEQWSLWWRFSACLHCDFCAYVIQINATSTDDPRAGCPMSSIVERKLRHKSFESTQLKE